MYYSGFFSDASFGILDSKIFQTVWRLWYGEIEKIKQSIVHTKKNYYTNTSPSASKPTIFLHYLIIITHCCAYPTPYSNFKSSFMFFCSHIEFNVVHCYPGLKVGTINILTYICIYMFMVGTIQCGVWISSCTNPNFHLMIQLRLAFLRINALSHRSTSNIIKDIFVLGVHHQFEEKSWQEGFHATHHVWNGRKKLQILWSCRWKVSDNCFTLW